MRGDDRLTEKPTPEVLRATARDRLAYIDRAIEEGTDVVKHFEDRLRDAQRRIVDLRNSRAQWAQLLKD